MYLLDRLAEARIAEAQERGEFEDLPGAGKRIALDDDTFVAPELRSAYRVLKNAGYLPPELESRRRITDLESLLHNLDGAEDDPQYHHIVRKINFLRASLEARAGRLSLAAEYAPAIYRRLGRDRA